MANQSSSPPPIEHIPSVQGGVSAIASAHAPILYFDGAPNFGVNDGIINVTLEALRFHAIPSGVVNDLVIVAHLRMSLSAARRLKQAVHGALLLAEPVSGTRN